MHVVAVLALHGVVPFDLAIPCEVFGRAFRPGANAAYEVRVCGEAGTVRSGHFDLRAPWRLGSLADATTVIVPGIADVSVPVPDGVIAALRTAAERGARIASICSGAFVLAAAGLLDGLRATTHWRAAPALAARYPRVRVDANVLFVDHGRILTSAGAAAGLDLCLHMLRQDHGAAAAAEAARLAVVPLERHGGQSQFITHPPPSSSARTDSVVFRPLVTGFGSAFACCTITGGEFGGRFTVTVTLLITLRPPRSAPTPMMAAITFNG